MKVKCAVWELFCGNCCYLQSEGPLKRVWWSFRGETLSYFTSCCYQSLYYPCNQICTAFPNCVNPFFSALFPSCSSALIFFFSRHPLCSCSPLSSFLRTALIKHGVGGGAESSSWAEEKGSNSTSQDGAVTHNGPTILLVPPWIPSWKALSSGSFLIGLCPFDAQTHARINTHVGAHSNTRVPVLNTHTHTSCSCVYAHVCHLYCSSHCFGPFEVLLRPMTAFLVSAACWGR